MAKDKITNNMENLRESIETLKSIDSSIEYMEEKCDKSLEYEDTSSDKYLCLHKMKRKRRELIALIKQYYDAVSDIQKATFLKLDKTKPPLKSEG